MTTAPSLIRATGFERAAARLERVRCELATDIINGTCPLSAPEQALGLRLLTLMRDDLAQCAAAEATGLPLPAQAPGGSPPPAPRSLLARCWDAMVGWR